MSLSSSKNVR